MLSVNNIYQGLSKFSISGQQKFCCVKDNGQDFGNTEEPLCQRKLFESLSALAYSLTHIISSYKI